MKCPACGEVMEMRVEVTLKLPANYVNLISKEVIKKKGVPACCCELGKSESYLLWMWIP